MDKLRWTHEPPKVPGLYLRKSHWTSSPSLREIDEDACRRIGKGDVVYWCGPLEIAEPGEEEK